VRPSDVPPSLFEEPAMAQQPTEHPAESRRSNTASGVAVITAALMVGLAKFATSEAAATAFASGRTGWEGIVRERVDIPMDGG
jgi:hypothetical protein